MMKITYMLLIHLILILTVFKVLLQVDSLHLRTSAPNESQRSRLLQEPNEDATIKYLSNDDMACRTQDGDSGSDGVEYERQHDVNNLEQCRDICSSSDWCKGIEWSDDRCEHWKVHAPNLEAKTGFHCMWKKDTLVIAFPSPTKDLYEGGSDYCTLSNPCEECEGDCDEDADCKGNLICFHRDKGDPTPPGCRGTINLDSGGTTTNKNDFCIRKQIDDPSTPDLHYGGKDYCTPSNPCEKCEGDCDDDADCMGELVCHQRHNSNDPLPPGCGGTPDTKSDYCVDPNLHFSGSNYCTPSNPCGKCQGDCDNDVDCIGKLVCYHRDEDDPPPPGCGGTPFIGDKNDYCGLPPPDNSGQPCGLAQAKRRSQIMSKLSEAVSSAGLMTNAGTPQYNAVEWLIETDGFLVCPDDQNMIQRYVMAMFYFSTKGDSWDICSQDDTVCANPYLSSAHECHWFGNQCDAAMYIIEIEQESNNVHGTLPFELQQLTELQVLSLEQGTLSSTIPSTLGTLNNLRVLDLDFNRLTGTIPEEIYGLTSLQVMDLNSNMLSGTLSASVRNLSNLNFLQLHENFMTGTIPNELGNIADIVVIELFNNKFTGTIPDSVCLNRAPPAGTGLISVLSADCFTNPVAQVVCSCCTRCGVF